MQGNFRICKNIFADFSLLITAAICIITRNVNIYYIAFSAILHELFHYFAACIAGYKPQNFIIKGFGIELSNGTRNFSPSVLIFVCICGPLANLLLAYIGMYINNFQFVLINISIAVINLLPALPLDGGQILYGIICKISNRRTAKTVIRIVGKFIGVLIILVGIAILFISKINFSLLYIGLYVFFVSSGNFYNPVVEVAFIKEKDFEKCVTISIKDSVKAIDAANTLPHNAIGAVKDETGKVYDFVSPYYLYNKLAKTNADATIKNILKKESF